MFRNIVKIMLIAAPILSPGNLTIIMLVISVIEELILICEYYIRTFATSTQLITSCHPSN